MISNHSSLNFVNLDLRYMQIEISSEIGKNLPGYQIINQFRFCEFLSIISTNENGIKCYLRVEFDDRENLHSPNPILEIEEIVSEAKTAALVKANITGPIPKIFVKIPNVWWVSPTSLDKDKFTLTVRGTRSALISLRQELRQLVGNGFGVKIGSEFLGGPEVDEILSEKQRLVLTTAIKMGYYGRPRQCTQREIAKVLDVKQATISEHLQSAESKIINAFHT